MHNGNLLMSHDNEDTDRPYVLSKTKEWVVATDPYFENIIYEDETYEISAACKGEFGGTVFFKHKITNKIYSCIATCLIDVERLNGSYYLTAVLNHMMGHSSILKVEDPTKLTLFDGEKMVNNWWIQKDMSPSDMLKGLELVMDTMNVSLFDTFIKDDAIYALHESPAYDHIIGYSDLCNLILSEVKNGKLHPIDTLQMYPPALSLASSQRTKCFSFFHYDSDDKEVLITVKNDTIEVVTLKK
jgi:hypothetical protein